MESSNDASDVDDDSERSVKSSEIFECNRPNRFKGPSSTWRKLTEDERLVFTSMTQQRDQDLSVHLYNAHAMKRRHYNEESSSKLKPWANKDRWRESKSGEDDENSINFVPPRSWTAWPLSSDVVPRTGEQIGVGDSADEWTLKRRESQRPSHELKDILMAITLRLSRDRFAQYKWESSRGQEGVGVEEKEINMHPGSDSMDRIEGEEAMEDISQDVLPNRSKNMSIETHRSRRARLGQDSETGDASPGAEGRLDDFPLVRESSKSPSRASTLQRPTVSADDERSRRILNPTIRHTLSRLDELLMALHHARQTCLYHASEQTESQSELEGVDMAVDDSDNNDPPHLPSSSAPIEPHVEQPAQRSRPGRPPKVLQMPAPSAADALESVEPHKRETRGRKRKLHIPLEGESHGEMLVRIARLQKKVIPFTASRTGSASKSPIKSARGSPKKRGTSAHTRERRSTRLGIRDWSEVLGTAALLSFSPKVIDRAARRCTNLFGEGITMLSLVENPRFGDEDQFVDYLPSEIPDFDNLDNQSSAGSESDEKPETGRQASRGHEQIRIRSENEMDINRSGPETRSSGVDTPYYCSYKGCPRYKRGFSKRKYLGKHLREVHKLEKKELNEAQGDSQEEMGGGVHVNGFMKEVKRRTGWRAVDGKPRRRKKIGERVKSEGSEEEGLQEEETSENSNDRLADSDGSLDEAFESD